MTLMRYVDGTQHGVQLIAVDSGPGFVDFAAAARDGHSTAGSLGIGLGVIMRSSTFFDAYSVPGQGTAMVSRVAQGAPRKPIVAAAAFEVAARSVPKTGEVECGDAWSLRDFGKRQLICIVDGLGHGPQAALAAQRAVSVFEAARPEDTPADIVLRAHEQIKDTRGAVMAVLALDPAAGTVGYRVRETRTQQVAWEPNAVAILCTDGLSGRWGLSNYPGLLSRHPSLIASVLFRDHASDTDDATIVVARRS